MQASTVAGYARRLRRNCEGVTLASAVPTHGPRTPARVEDLPPLTLAYIGAVFAAEALAVALRAWLCEQRDARLLL